MTIYVDDMYLFEANRHPKWRYKSHMIGDTADELRQMAIQIELSPRFEVYEDEWRHHWLLTHIHAKRAIELGAVDVRHWRIKELLWDRLQPRLVFPNDFPQHWESLSDDAMADYVAGRYSIRLDEIASQIK